MKVRGETLLEMIFILSPFLLIGVANLIVRMYP